VICEAPIFVLGETFLAQVASDKGVLPWLCATGDVILRLSAVASRLCLFSFALRDVCHAQQLPLAWLLHDDEFKQTLHQLLSEPE